MIRKHIPVLAFCLFVLVLYIHNLSSSVYGGDVGDLVTASSLMGVAHPPGYPLFTIFGFFLTRFTFLHLTQAFLVGLISAVSATIGLGAFYFLSFSLSKNRLASWLATFTLAFSFLYWFYAEIAEVFALNSMFALLLLLVAFFYRQTPTKLLLGLMVFLIALSLTNHQTIVLIFPSLLLLVGGRAWKSCQKSKKTILVIIAGFIVGLLPYLYIPLASSHHPIINWDNVHDLKSFLHLVLRQDYGTFQAGRFDTPTFMQRLITLKVYSLYLLSQLTIPVVAISIVGFVILLRREKIIGISLVLAFLLSGPVFIAYAGFPLTGSFILGVYERFFILSSIVLLIPFSIGILWIVTRLSNILSRKIYITVFQLVFFIIPITLLFYNFPKTNLSQVMVGDTYAEDLLNSLPPYSLLVFSGDTLVFNTWYVHYVRHVRPDVVLYNFGGEIQNSAAGTALDNHEVRNKAENKLDKFITTLIDNAKGRPVFSSLLLEPTNDNKKIRWVPYGLVYQLTLSSDQLPSRETYILQQKSLWNSFHLPSAEDKKKNVFHNLTISEFPGAYSNASLATGTFFYTQFADSDAALSYYKKAIEVDPENAKAYETLGAYYIGAGGKCTEVVDNLTKAVVLDPFEKLPYFLLYATYKDCFHRQDLAKSVASQFNTVFQEDFTKEMKKQVNDIFLK